MADGTIAVSEGAGKNLDTEQLTVSAVTVQRERIQIAGATDVAISVVRNDAPVSTDYGLVTRNIPSGTQDTTLAVASPVTSFATSAAVAAGGSVDINGTQITSSLTGKLVGVVLTSSVAVKGELRTVTNAVASGILAVFFARAGDTQPITMPSKEFFTVAHDAGAGLDAFRIRATNLDTTQAADIYVTFLYDEE